MASKQISICVTGKLVWDLIFESDNSENTGEIEHTYNATLNNPYPSSEFLKLVSEAIKRQSWSGELVQVEIGVSYEVVSANSARGHNSAREISDMLERATPHSQGGERISWSSADVKSRCKVGPKSKLFLCQRKFHVEDWPLYMSNGTLRTTTSRLTDKETAESVPIVFTLRPIRWLVGLNVVYTRSASSGPKERVRELYGRSDDINKGSGGEYVWLVPVWSTDTQQALSSFDLAIQNTCDYHLSDLAKGAAGDWRYPIPVRSPDTNLFITDVSLFRCDSSACSPPAGSGFTGKTDDINRGRGGKYLYLIWKTMPAYPI
ncbi:hypothetical protein BC834DRAFT_898167 [Gloeopeniophorella convolvens]|nr:hypothetical protein BC834DRAFT_898167 [Gloeopeniophorella convolvens]